MAGYAQQARNVISLACALNAKKMRGMKGIQAARVKHQERAAELSGGHGIPFSQFPKIFEFLMSFFLLCPLCKP